MTKRNGCPSTVIYVVVLGVDAMLILRYMVYTSLANDISREPLAPTDLPNGLYEYYKFTTL